VAGKLARMLAQLVDLFDPLGLTYLATFIGVPILLLVSLVVAIRADFRQPRGEDFDRRAFPVDAKNDLEN